MKNQILKAAKGLRQFTIEDLELITGFDETDILEVIENNNIRQVNGIYLFQDFKAKKVKIKTGLTGKNILLKNYAQRFMETLKCEDSTKKSYEIYLRLHINPYLGFKRVIDITSADIDTFKFKKLRECSSNKNINNFINLLNRIFEYAINQDLILKNPCHNIEKLKTESKKQTISNSQLNNLLSLAKQEDFGFYVLLLTAIKTGLSRGKVLDLKWSDIDFENRIIKEISTSEDLLSVLNKWYKICPICSSNLIFPNKNGNKICADNMIKRRFKPLCQRAGLQNLRFIDLKTYS